MNGVVKQYSVDPPSCHNPQIIVDPYPDQMPPLAYEPPLPVKQPFKTVAERLGKFNQVVSLTSFKLKTIWIIESAGNRNTVEDRIEFNILTDQEDVQERSRVRMTLNERFQK